MARLIFYKIQTTITEVFPKYYNIFFVYIQFLLKHKAKYKVSLKYGRIKKVSNTFHYASL